MGTNRNNMPTTYAEIDAALGDRKQMTLCNNTVAYRHDWEHIEIALHGHVIVRLFPSGFVGVRHCGYVSVTTFDRINRFVPSGWKATRSNGMPRICLTSGGFLHMDRDTFTYLDRRNSVGEIQR